MQRQLSVARPIPNVMNKATKPALRHLALREKLPFTSNPRAVSSGFVYNLMLMEHGSTGERRDRSWYHADRSLSAAREDRQALSRRTGD